MKNEIAIEARSREHIAIPDTKRGNNQRAPAAEPFRSISWSNSIANSEDFCVALPKIKRTINRILSVCGNAMALVNSNNIASLS